MQIAKVALLLILCAGIAVSQPIANETTTTQPGMENISSFHIAPTRLSKCNKEYYIHLS
jgi:hypothetical protein